MKTESELETTRSAKNGQSNKGGKGSCVVGMNEVGVAQGVPTNISNNKRQ